ncbi:MAG: pyruvate kinase [Desulfocapsaceae bacterium]
MTSLQTNKTKLVCTIGPASDSPEMIENMIQAGMNVARLNFSHGDFEYHGKVIRNIRVASERIGKRVAIMADLPGPKMRIGKFADDSVQLDKDAEFTLNVEDIVGNASQVSISMKQLPNALHKGDILFLNDGLIQLVVEKIPNTEIQCRVLVGGELRSRKGLNIPGIDLGSSAFTSRDRECMQFALEHGVDAISQSFVSNAQDLKDVRGAAQEMGFDPFIIAKIERASIHKNIDEILEQCDGIMVARGDLGVEIPIEQIAVVQKFVIARANLAGKPVITATQMLESMTHNRRPTRAEATDVANAILDGTDCVMLSEESAMGAYPIESVSMLAKICAATEPHRLQEHRKGVLIPQIKQYLPSFVDHFAGSIEKLLKSVEDPAAVFIPTTSGQTARSVTRARLPVWILAASSSPKTCQELMLSYGVWPIENGEWPSDWTGFLKEQIDSLQLDGKSVLAVEGPSPVVPDRNHKIELIPL